MQNPKHFKGILLRISVCMFTITTLFGMSLNAHSQDKHQVYLPLVKAEGKVTETPSKTTTTTSTTTTTKTSTTTTTTTTTRTSTSTETKTPTTSPTSKTPPPQSGKWVSAYYVGYQRGLLPEEQIDWTTLSHIIVGRIRPDFNGGVITNFDIDDVTGPQMAKNISRLAHQNGRKAILMLGGAGEYDAFVASASDANRTRFVSNLIRTMDELGYDGLDIDWEPIETKDQPQVRALLQELRAARPNIILTMPIGWVNANFPDQAEPFYADISQYLDQINLMSYGMSGPWGWLSWHSSALEGHGGLYPSSVSNTVDNYLAAGIPAAKLGVGTGFYGQCWTGVTQPRADTSGANEIANDNDMSYTNIVTRYLNQPGATRTFDNQAKVPYISSQTGVGPLGCNYISYEDAESIALKGKYVHDKGLGGTIIWTINQGYLPAAPASQRHPLMQAMKEHFLK